MSQVEKRETLIVPRRGEVWLQKDLEIFQAYIVGYRKEPSTVFYVLEETNWTFTSCSLPLDRFNEKFTRGPGRIDEEWEYLVAKHDHEIEQILGKALGYPPLYPDVSKVDDGTVCVGEHVPETLAAEAAATIAKLRAENRAYMELLAQMTAPILKPVIDSLKSFVTVLTEHGTELVTELQKLQEVKRGD